jgi:hypothetical protein
VDDDALLAEVLRRIMRAPSGWSLSNTELSIAGGPPARAPRARGAGGAATGKPTVADPYIRGYRGDADTPAG